MLDAAAEHPLCLGGGYGCLEDLAMKLDLFHAVERHRRIFFQGMLKSGWPVLTRASAAPEFLLWSASLPAPAPPGFVFSLLIEELNTLFIIATALGPH